MNIAKYRLELDENRHNILVKESDLDYNGKGFQDPLAVAYLFKNNLRLHMQAEEHLYMVALSTNCEPLGIFEISHGWLICQAEGGFYQAPACRREWIYPMP